jgi:cysteine-rich repeat protein
MHVRSLVSLVLALGVGAACGGGSSGGGSGVAVGGSGGVGGTGGGTGGEGGVGGTAEPPRCGDGRVDEGEGCDDGNLVDGDGCSSACVSSCGDGVFLAGVETCEDGNRIAGDGCSPDCRLERGTCSAAPVRDLGSYPAGLTHLQAAGTTDGLDDAATPSCAAAEGGEVVFGLFVPERAFVEFSTDAPGTAADTVLSVRRGDCTRPDAELACHDDIGGTGRATASRVVLEDVAAGTQLYVIVDTKAPGDFVLDAWVRPPADEGEACGRTGGPRCVAGLDCIGGVCGPIACGDGTVSPGEACDPASDPGCLPDCTYPVCGDGVVQGLEACDDGNADDTDGCTSLCLVPACGDGVRTPDEECDDGSATDDGDGCAGCRLGCRADVPAYRALPYGTSCLVVPDDRRRNFWTGSALCGSLGGHLVTVLDADENEVLRRVVGGNAWIGLTDGKDEGNFQWLVGTSDYRNWNDGEPNDWGGQEDCAELYPESGRWNDNNCGAGRWIACELPRN